MKKITSLLLALLMLMGILAVPTMAAADEVSVYLFGEKLEFDVPAQIVNGRTLVPVRKIFEELGYKVDWDNDTRTAIAISEERTIRITENSYTMYVNEEAKTLDVPAQIIGGRTMVPARAISESSGYKVDWDGDTRSVLITEPSALDKKIVGTIGGYEISQAYYNCMYFVVYSSYAQYSQYYGSDWMNMDAGNGYTIAEMIDIDTRNQLEQLTVGVLLAEKNYGITLDDVRKETKELMDETIGSYQSKEEFDAFLKSVNTTETALETYFGMGIILNLLPEKTATDGKLVSVSDAEVGKLFDETFEGKMKVKHILVSTASLDGYTPARPDAEAKSIVNEILAKLKNGEDFGKLIDFYNEDPGQTSESYYVFGEGEMVAEFETASKNLAVGKYTTQAVKTDYGYHIIKRYPLDNTSEEYEETKIYLIQQKLLPFIEAEVEKTTIKWND